MKHGLPLGLLAGAGIPPDQLRAQRKANFEDVAPVAWNPDARLLIQDEENVPHYMHRADHAAERMGTGTEEFINRKPSNYIRENIWFTFQDDETAYESDKLLNNDKLLLAAQMANITEEQKNAIAHDNVIKAFNLPIQ